MALHHDSRLVVILVFMDKVDTSPTTAYVIVRLSHAHTWLCYHAATLTF